MPLIRPEIQKILRESGLLESEEVKARKDARPLAERLDAAGLGLDETLEELAMVAKGSGNESLRVRCLETVLKAHGALKESAPSAPSFTIVIQGQAVGDPSHTKQANIPDGVNPILLPRQLLTLLNTSDSTLTSDTSN